MRTRAWHDGDKYEPYVGRWSRLVAAEFIEWLDVPAERRWLDVGCGTGALSAAILALADPHEVRGIDTSIGFVEDAQRRIDEPRFSAEVADARKIPSQDGSFDAVVSGLVLNFVPDRGGAARELTRVAAPGGIVGAYVWDYAGGMQMMRYFWDAATDLDPMAREHDEGERFGDVASVEALAGLWRIAGLEAIETRAIDVRTIFANFDDFWSPFLGGQAPAPAYCMSLDEPKRAKLRQLLELRLPVEADGTIRLTARAWAAKGRRPERRDTPPA